MSAIAAADLGWLESPFVRSIDAASLSFGVVATALAVAVAAGALHGLRPGHGKTVAAAYLVGSRGGYRTAVGVGIAVASAHTLSVLVLGGVLLLLTRNPVATVPEQALSLVPALLLIGIGAVLVRRHLRARVPVLVGGQPPEPEPASAPAHDHRHRHEHPHEHPHLAPRGATLGIACFGGLAPSPSALLLMASGTVAGRLAYGLVLVAAFSVGLAASVALAGVAVLRGRDLLERRAASRPALARAVPALPLLGALGVLGVGLGATGLSILRWVG